MEIWQSITNIFSSSDLVTLLILAVVAVGAGLAMRRISSIVTATVGAMVVFAVAVFVRRVTVGGKDAAALAQTDWHNLLSLQVHVVLAYAIAFGTIIALVHYVRTAVMR
jgi:hypothetical protein